MPYVLLLPPSHERGDEIRVSGHLSDKAKQERKGRGLDLVPSSSRTHAVSSEALNSGYRAKSPPFFDSVFSRPHFRCLSHW